MYEYTFGDQVYLYQLGDTIDSLIDQYNVDLNEYDHE